MLDEAASKELLRAAGVTFLPETIARDARDAAAAAAAFGVPLATYSPLSVNRRANLCRLKKKSNFDGLVSRTKKFRRKSSERRRSMRGGRPKRPNAE